MMYVTHYEKVGRENFKLAESITFEPDKEGAYTLVVSRGCMEKMGKPRYFNMLVSPEKKMIAILPCRGKKKSKDAVRAVYGEDGSVRVPCGAFFKRLAGIMEWEEGRRYAVQGNRILSEKGKTLRELAVGGDSSAKLPAGTFFGKLAVILERVIAGEKAGGFCFPLDEAYVIP
ncbi:MAG: hypothetical protein K5746_10835 [Clostridiales bacterium]|nr:hypothetical protein [Clostridiales bacterium]